MTDQLNISSWTCPLPLQNYPTIVMGHGSGGKMMSDLIRHMFLPPLENETLNQLGDSAVLELDQNMEAATRVAFSLIGDRMNLVTLPGDLVSQ